MGDRLSFAHFSESQVPKYLEPEYAGDNAAESGTGAARAAVAQDV